ncbi:MAG: prephenate dehydrogenase/arogenate dehydrogenase family protein [Endomicrobia bacterium]|nr:prephenate dehydrogenase/arogenate dehydrogenase family protein [Endomicrobiia bacterium]MCL2799582.1 prephenate dehydrogenase/arogenate dehydrogenase family protein [Endomicrobiia bacterium]
MINVAIIGLGQMGGSLGLALKSKSAGNKYYIIGIARKQETLKTALKIGAVDKVSLSLQDAKDCDIVVICTPVDTIVPIYKQLSKIVEKDTIITDTGSVKEEIEKQIKYSLLTTHCSLPFVAVHPMAGKEKSGILSADAEMFKNANVIITGSFKKSEKNEKLVAKMWKDAGANIINMPAKKHDELVALTSHLTHCVAFSFNKIYKDVKKKNPEVDKITAGSFKSMVRVAASSADMWAPIFAANNKNIIKHLDAFIKELNVFKKILKSKGKVKREILNTQK